MNTNTQEISWMNDKGQRVEVSYNNTHPDCAGWEVRVYEGSTEVDSEGLDSSSFEDACDEASGMYGGDALDNTDAQVASDNADRDAFEAARGIVTKIVVRTSQESVHPELADAYCAKLEELLSVAFPGADLDVETQNACGKEIAVFDVAGEMDPEGYEVQEIFDLTQRAYEAIV